MSLTKYCPKCGTATTHTENKPWHLFHAVMTALTCGFWAIVWAYCVLNAKGPKCTKCGTTN